MSVLFLKLTLAPVLVAGASLAGRRYGPRVGGWMVGFPLVAGPVLWFYAREQGAAFAERAAAGTVMGVVSLCVFLLAYAWCARRLPWLPTVLVGWLGFVATTLLLMRAPALADASWPTALGIAFAALALTQRGLPRAAPPRMPRRPRHDLALRMIATAALVLVLTAAAHVLGPSLSGLLTPFPIATTILVVFAHRDAGAAGVVAVYGGFIPSLYSFAAFCAALSFALARWPVPLAFTIALGIAAVAQTLVLAIVSRRQRATAA